MTPDMLPDIHLTYWLEVFIASLFTLIYPLAAFATLRQRHCDKPKLAVIGGAALQGFLIGLVIAFVLLPMRVGILEGTVDVGAIAPQLLAAFLILIGLRRGTFARLPILGGPFRAYRRANLRRAIETAQNELDKLQIDAGDRKP